MKKLLLGSLSLLIFSLSILVFQISCKKDANAGPTEIMQQNKICYFRYNASLGEHQIWIANYDGTSATALNISLPAGYRFRSENCSLSPDGQKIFFIAFDSTAPNHLFVCNIDGSGLVEIVTSNTDMKFGNAI